MVFRLILRPRSGRGRERRRKQNGGRVGYRSFSEGVFFFGTETAKERGANGFDESEGRDLLKEKNGATEEETHSGSPSFPNVLKIGFSMANREGLAVFLFLP